jgi:HK97 gp10 family phage protein
MTSINVSLDGMQQLLNQMKKLGADADAVVLKTITDLVLQTQGLAKIGIQRGPKSGRTYQRGNITHQASAPGQYPATDTGRLASSVMIDLPVPGGLTGRVGTNVQYGPMLEFGTSRMAARPWLLPSFTQAKINVEKKLKAQLEAQI